MLLDTGSGCASPLSIDGVAFWCWYLVDFKVLNGPSRTNGARPLHLRTKGIYPSVNKAISLFERMEVKPTIQMTKKLEQRFLKLDNEVRTRAGFYEDDYSSDEDMS